jgi:hypothetical protein
MVVFFLSIDNEISFQPGAVMNDSQALVSRRSVLLGGMAVSLVGVSVEAMGGNLAQESVLSGRLTHASGSPERNALVSVSGIETRTDADGRFFMQAALPMQGPIALSILRLGEPSRLTMSVAAQRTRDQNRTVASVSLRLTA